jgi:dolichyl-phosphate-mannose-protein mannosyltransferase
MTGPETGSTIARAAPGATRPRVSRRILALVVLVVALSAVVRIVDLARYPGTVFDEHYYVHDAGVILHGELAGSRAEPWKPAALRSAAHPDLAKLAIAAGIAVLGDNAWGWRLPAALAGVALVALVFPLGRRLGLSDEWALAALVLSASDPMLMLESRLAVLDVFVALATTAVVYLALRYVQSDFRIGWLVACGAAVGAAVACKWSGVLAVPAALVVLVPPLAGRGRGGVRLLTVFGALVLTPLAVYLAASVPYFAAGHGPLEWLRLQQYMATFGWGVKGDRSFASRPATWPFDAHPIWYAWSIGPRGTSGLLAIGNFLVWWAGVAAWVVLGLLAILRRDWRLGLVPALVAVLYLPWLFTSRQTYIYYMLPVIPFVAIVVATGLSRLVGAPWAPPPGASLGAGRECGGEPRFRRLAAWAFCLACVVVGALYVPFVIGFPVPFDYYVFLTPFTTWK